jgi:hypothetical protein
LWFISLVVLGFWGGGGGGGGGSLGTLSTCALYNRAKYRYVNHLEWVSAARNLNFTFG